MPTLSIAAAPFRLSRWMTAWISLSIGVRSWTGTPPPGERNGALAQRRTQQWFELGVPDQPVSHL